MELRGSFSIKSKPFLTAKSETPHDVSGVVLSVSKKAVTSNNYITSSTCSVHVGSLSTRVFETRTATGREHFAC